MAAVGGATASRFDPHPARSLRVIGRGRAGMSFQRSLEKAGWRAQPALGRDDDIREAASGVDLLVIATSDAAIVGVAAAVEVSPSTVVAHLSGSHGLDVLAPHVRRAAIHPLRSIPTPTTDLTGAWFAVAGDGLAASVVEDLGGQAVAVRDGDRAAYHAAAVVASNHVVALLGQVERIAGRAGVPLAAFLDLARGAIDNVELLGPAAALTGPVARGDWATVERHLGVLDPSERRGYEAVAALAARLVAERGAA